MKMLSICIKLQKRITLCFNMSKKIKGDRFMFMSDNRLTLFSLEGTLKKLK